MHHISNSLALIVVVNLCLGCHDKSEPLPAIPPSTRLDGTYDVQSIVCEYAIDLDRDGVFSTDLLAEAHETGNASRYYAEFRTTIYHWEPDFYDQEISLVRPFANVFRDDQGNVIDVLYGFTNLLCRYAYDESTNRITAFRNLGSGEIHEVNMLSDGVLEIRFSASYFSNNDWRTLPLKGVYKRK
ncbi:hypothetical protein [Chryseolinea lacunae]|uniref:Uncharacterized protein n=1 Tax=Chryseolinea lacunae TaxID=2801331 RepID=A0ABS1KWV5_9BACT|nr:hypothetical protein [Chryseolinea lacunae]MBL0743889.1 hypothetical protein [Chryseolinea lacunae]